MSSAGVVEGTAAEIAPQFVKIDPELEGRCTPRRLGKRFAALWPHIEKALRAHRETDRTRLAHFRFEPGCAGYAGYQEHVPENPSQEDLYNDFSGTRSGKPAKPAELALMGAGTDMEGVEL